MAPTWSNKEGDRIGLAHGAAILEKVERNIGAGAISVAVIASTMMAVRPGHSPHSGFVVVILASPPWPF